MPVPSLQIDTSVGPFTISTDKARLDIGAIHAYLTRSYWAEGIGRDLVTRSIENSLCFGVYAPDGAQAGFARLVTDHATFAYLCDVYVLEDYRGLALGKALAAAVADHPVMKVVRRAMLATRDAHGLYAKVGFAPLPAPERFMEINRADIYTGSSNT